MTDFVARPTPELQKARAAVSTLTTERDVRRAAGRTRGRFRNEVTHASGE